MEQRLAVHIVQNGKFLFFGRKVVLPHKAICGVRLAVRLLRRRCYALIAASIGRTLRRGRCWRSRAVHADGLSLRRMRMQIRLRLSLPRSVRMVRLLCLLSRLLRLRMWLPALPSACRSHSRIPRCVPIVRRRRRHSSASPLRNSSTKL